MPPQEPEGHPLDPDALARCAADPSQPRAAREAAVVALRPFLRDTARRVAARLNVRDPEWREELQSVAEERLWFGAYQADKGPFAAWCYTVMRNRLLDLLEQRHGVGPLPAAPVCNPQAQAFLLNCQANAAWHATFTEDDLRRLRSWGNPRHRVAVLCRSLLWVKVPEAEWHAWLMEAGLDIDPAEPFPPDGFCDWEPAERNRFLAGALGLSRAALNQIAHRTRPELLRLDFVQGLLP